jgi:hypothetical protein
VEGDGAQVTLAVHTLVNGLAEAAYTSLFDAALPSVLLTQINDQYDAFLFRHANAATTAYFCALARPC